jgi:hypothetical protein
MMSDPDDEALRWGGDEPDHVAAPAPVAETDEEPQDSPPRTSSPLLVAYGIVGGVTLLYVIGWIIAVRRDTFTQPSLFAEVMYQLGEFLAIASPVIWMGAVLLLTTHAKTGVRIALLLIGLLLLAPWPFILGVGA